jgi:hypothetical protein
MSKHQIQHALRRFRTRRTLIVVGTVLGTALAFTLVGNSALAVLAGSPSNFEASDGNMVVDTTGNNDWNSVQNSPNYVHLTDLFKTTQDDSFQSGQKQDAPCPVINTNKNPPKDDFTDIASYTETNFDSTSPYFHHTFLDGATIRVAANGNASENVELNQGTNGICPGTTDQLARSAGDKLIAIDYLNGGTNVQFHVLTWVTSGTCFVNKDTAPCWGSTVQTLTSNSAEGLVNQSPIAAADNLINNLALVTGQFAEFGIDLTAAGIIPAGTCKAFPQTIWESRASGSSFVSSTEDVSVEKHTIANCGHLTIIKHTDPRGLDQVFTYTSNLSANASAGGVSGVAADGSFSLNDVDNTHNTVSEELFAGTYHVTEGADPAGFAFESLTCDSGSYVISGKTVTVTLAVGDNVTCTYVNARTDTTGITSAQSWQPNDSTTVTATNGTPLNGTLSAQLYTGSTCASGSEVTGQLYTKTLTDATTAADRTLTTNNTTYTVSASTSVSWLVTFTSTNPNVAGSSHCESTSLTVTN